MDTLCTSLILSYPITVMIMVCIWAKRALLMSNEEHMEMLIFTIIPVMNTAYLVTYILSGESPFSNE